MTVSKLNSSEYFNISQFRLDNWNNLKAQADILSNIGSSGKNNIQAISNIDATLDQLGLLEQFWAFPGIYRLSELKKIY